MAILVAGTADAVHTARVILGEGFDYRCACSLEEARAQLGPDLELVLCNLRFDDGRMIDFLAALRDEGHCTRLPVVCFHAHAWEVSRSAREAVAQTLQALDNACFVDLYAIARARGVAAAAAALRHVVGSAISGEAAAVA
jgi:hypothetical protein